MRKSGNAFHQFLYPLIGQMMKIGHLALVLFILPFCLNAQTASYKQFANEIQISRTINDKWVGELNVIGTFSDTPNESQVLKTFIQRAALGWAHYYYSPRWKFSSFLAYYYNKDVPDIGQFEAPEWRFGLQGIYYINKIGYTLSTRMRAELRFIGNEEGGFDDVYRYRQQIKYLKPINSMTLRKGVYYVVTSDEIFLRSTTKATGSAHFDRNFFYLGGGYLVTDDLQLELAYSNEFLPRDNGNQIYNALNLTITFNNLAKNVRKKVVGLFSNPTGDE
jgi:hypothetical protein